MPSKRIWMRTPLKGSPPSSKKSKKNEHLPSDYLKLLPANFDVSEYKRFNPDLAVLSTAEAEWHYISCGKMEGRFLGRSQRSVGTVALPLQFSPQGYLSQNPDLQHMSLAQAEMHYVLYGRNEHRHFLPKLLPIPVHTTLTPQQETELLACTSGSERECLVEQWTEQTRAKNAIQRIAMTVSNCGVDHIKKDVLVVLHLGARTNLLDEFVPLLQSLTTERHSFDVFISVFDATVQNQIISKVQAVVPKTSLVSVLVVENKALDIGPFWKCLGMSLQNKVQYDCIFKWHTKGNDTIRKVAHSVFQTPNRIISVLRVPETSVGMIGAEKLHDQSNLNDHWLKFITTELGLDDFANNEKWFVAITIFACRYQLLAPYIHSMLQMIDRYGNTFDSVDWNWFCWMHDVAPSPSNASLLTQALKSPSNAFPFVGNAYWQFSECMPLPRDGMFEHALERFFGHLSVRHNMRILNATELAVQG